MINSHLKNKQVMIIDREPKTDTDRTWCFWAQESRLYDLILYRNWKKLRFCRPSFSKTFDLAPFYYKMLRGIDFFHHTQAALRQPKNVHFLYADGEGIKSQSDGASVMVDGQPYQVSS
jgi:lycopene beta-cyclase